MSMLCPLPGKTAMSYDLKRGDVGAPSNVGGVGD